MHPSVPFEALRALVRRVSGDEPQSIQPMAGGASARLFWRVVLARGGSAVAMYVPDAGVSEEIVKGDAPRRWPYLEVQELLERHSIRVPRLLGEACDSGWILVEDLGDLTLAEYLVSHEEHRTELYRQAVRDLGRAQQELATLPTTSIVRQRRFDYDLLKWEVDHFREWALEARGVCLGAEDQASFEAAVDYLACTISSWPYGFVHRDYQSRNLMVVGDGVARELAWIDFQDALMGPRVYDLVALLSDSYQTFPRAFVEARLDDYAAELGLDAAERQKLGQQFDLVTVQRKLKDAGRFVFIDRVKNNPSFLQFVEPTVEKVRTALARLSGHPELAALDSLLDRVLG